MAHIIFVLYLPRCSISVVFKVTTLEITDDISQLLSHALTRMPVSYY